MGNFVLVYTGGNGMGMSEAEQQAIMADWGAWYGQLGDSLVDGGSAFGAAKSVSDTGVSDAAIANVTGYTIISADSLDDAVAKVESHPHIKHGGQVTVYQPLDM
ncbi:MAG: hypothetical protein WBC91_20065 [Phototrophicaceae bacterium]